MRHETNAVLRGIITKQSNIHLSMLDLPVWEMLLMPELLFFLFSISFHAKTLRFRTTSTCLCFWKSVDDSNLGCFSILPLTRVISYAVVRWFSCQLSDGPLMKTRPHVWSVWCQWAGEKKHVPASLVGPSWEGTKNKDRV